MQHLYFQIRPHSEVLGVRPSIHLFGEHSSTHNSDPGHFNRPCPPAAPVWRHLRKHLLLSLDETERRGPLPRIPPSTCTSGQASPTRNNRSLRPNGWPSPPGLGQCQSLPCTGLLVSSTAPRHSPQQPQPSCLPERPLSPSKRLHRGHSFRPLHPTLHIYHPQRTILICLAA